MSLLDFETSAEEIQEDEELIEAVEHLVETAAVTIYTDIVNDVDSFVARTQSFIYTLLPFLVDWQQDESIFWEDMENLAICLFLFLVAFFVLAPSTSRRKQTRSWLSFADPITVERSASFDSVRTKPLSLRSRSMCSFSETTPLSCGGRIQNQDESAEVKFARMWPSILETDYRRLVLPPHCKLVEKPKKVPSKKEDKPKQGNESHKEEEYDDDHPLHRLRNYYRQFLHLVVSLLRYDYMGAGWTLICWIQACLKSRQHRGQPEVDDDDESTVASTKGGSASVQSASSASACTKKEHRHSSRSKRQPSLKTSSLGIDCQTNATMDNSRVCDSQSNLFEETSASNDEEKKESTYDSIASSQDIPPCTPLSTVEIHEFESCDRVAARTALHARPSTGIKMKDHLESYRGVPLPKPSSVSRSPRLHSLEAPSSQPDRSLRISSPRRMESPATKSGSSFFFETATSQESLKKMALQIPVPDKNGYILGDEFLPDNSFTPLLVFVNSRSGPQQGHILITQLRGLLNPIQVWDLADGGPESILESFCVLKNLRILVCGGDGTVSWIVSTIEKMNLQRWPPIAILPLGTGNDLARIHGWGGGYNNESLIDILEQVAESYISWLDRWEMTVVNKKGKVKSVKSFFNYLGVGADAQAALQVHMLRESRPQLFFSRVVNKAWYGLFGAEDIIKATSVNLPNEITLIADGVEVPLPADSQGIILLNIDSYAGGVPLWSNGSKIPLLGGETHHKFGTERSRSRRGSFGHEGFRRSRSLDEMRRLSGRARACSFDRVDSVEDIASMALSEEEKFSRVTACDKPSSCQDGLLDIVSIRGAFHLGQIRVGLSNAQQLCQCREATIIINRKVSVQIDGEPWRQNVCTLQVKRKKDAAIMLHRSADESNGFEKEMARLLDWAEEKNLIDDKVHAKIMKEFSRRIESKTRQRRVRSQDNIMLSLKRAIGSTGNFAKGVGGNSYSGGSNIMF